MADRDEMQILRDLSSARDSGDLRAELEALRRLRGLQPTQVPQPQVPAPSVGRRAAARFVSNALGLPAGVGELLEIGAAGLQAGAGAIGSAVTGGDGPGFGQRFEAARQQQSQQFPASALQAIPSPSPEQVLAGTETIKRIPKIAGSEASLGSEFQNQLQLQQAQAAQHPIATGAGDVLGDIGSILSLRPALRGRFRSARARTSLPEETVDIIDSAANRLTRITGFSKRLGAQAGEAGFEGALLAAVGEGDPIATAGWTAGAQVGGSLALQGSQAFARYPWRSLGGIALAHWVYRALAPGSQGALEDVRDETIQTMLTTFGLGTLAALAGAGRLAPGRTAGRDRFIDSFDTIRRAPIASIISQISKADEEGGNPLPQVLGKLAEDPNFFGTEIRRRIERAANSEREDALIKEVNSLMRSERFRMKLDELE